MIKEQYYLYSKSNVLLVADVFEKSRNKHLEKYGLCPSYYLSALALSWDVMILLFEKGIRGWCFCFFAILKDIEKQTILNIP